MNRPSGSTAEQATVMKKNTRKRENQHFNISQQMHQPQIVEIGFDIVFQEAYSFLKLLETIGGNVKNVCKIEKKAQSVFLAVV